MENKENIGTLIKSQLGNLKKSPDDALWDKINSSLDKRDRRRKKYFLLFFISFLILLSFLIFKPFGNFDNNSNQIIQSTETDSNSLNTKVDTLDSIDSLNIRTTNSTNYNQPTLDYIFPLPDNDIRRASLENLYFKGVGKFNFKENATGELENENSKQKNFIKKPPVNNKKPTSKINKKTRSQDRSDTEDSLKNQNEKLFSETAFNEKKPDQNEEIISDDSEEESTKTLNDSLKKPAKKDAKIIPQKEQVNRWGISIASGLVIYTPFNKGSLINSRLDSNSKSGNITFSYGASLNYYVNENLTVGIGANKNRMSYTTANIPSSNEVEINWILNHSTLDAIPNNSIAQLTDFIGEDAEINLVHQIDYLELPLHITYRFTNNRFGFLINGGISMSFVNSNKLFAQNSTNELLNLGNIITLVDRNVNLNLGTGVFYNLTDKFSIELSPYFKYSLRKYNLKEGTDKPNLLGINTVLTYKFW